jgi:hypothetical protein
VIAEADDTLARRFAVMPPSARGALVAGAFPSAAFPVRRLLRLGPMRALMAAPRALAALRTLATPRALAALRILAAPGALVALRRLAALLRRRAFASR